MDQGTSLQLRISESIIAASEQADAARAAGNHDAQQASLIALGTLNAISQRSEQFLSRYDQQDMPLTSQGLMAMLRLAQGMLDRVKSTLDNQI